jgi:class 3 adenylate cyclase
MAVHIGARVLALAGAGEVLVTRTVRDLVAGWGVAFVDRGVRELKGVPGEWDVLAVDGAGERAGPGSPASVGEAPAAAYA